MAMRHCNERPLLGKALAVAMCMNQELGRNYEAKKTLVSLKTV